MMEIVLKALASGCAVALILWLSKLGKTNLAGLLIVFPVVSLISYYFIGIAEGYKKLQSVIKASFYALPTLLFFWGVVYILSPKIGIAYSLFAGFLAWATVAFLLLKLQV